MNTDNRSGTRTRWGRAKFGGGRIPAMAVAIPAGLATGALAGWISLLSGVAKGEHALLFATLIAFAMSWSLVALAWALVVDRLTIIDALAKPEESIESMWLDTAMAGAMRDILIITGISLTVISIFGIKFDATWALIGVILIAFFSTAVRYLMAKKRG